MMSGTKLMTPPTPSMMPESTSDLSWPSGSTASAPSRSRANPCSTQPIGISPMVKVTV